MRHLHTTLSLRIYTSLSASPLSLHTVHKGCATGARLAGFRDKRQGWKGERIHTEWEWEWVSTGLQKVKLIINTSLKHHHCEPLHTFNSAQLIWKPVQMWVQGHYSTTVYSYLFMNGQQKNNLASSLIIVSVASHEQMTNMSGSSFSDKCNPFQFLNGPFGFSELVTVFVTIFFFDILKTQQMTNY